LDCVTDSVLGLTLGGVDHIEDPEQRRMYARLGDRLAETLRREDPDLREQEAEVLLGLVAR
jgi:hypothetical protein